MSHATLVRLGSMELFAGCRRSHLEAIDRLGVTLDVPAGRTLCREGMPGTEFFVLLSGVVDVRAASGLAVLRPGAWFGEVALLDHAPRRATVTTRTPAALLVFGKREFSGLLSIEPLVRDRLERTAALVVAGMGPTDEPWYEPLPIGLANLALESI